MPKTWTSAELAALVTAAKTAGENAAGWATRRRIYDQLVSQAPDNLCSTGVQNEWLRARETVGALAMPLTGSAS